MKIEELLQKLDSRKIPQVHEDDGIDEVIRVMVRFPHTRLVYVCDDRKRLVGTITVGSLLRHIFPHHYQERVHGRGIIRGLTAETARNIMDVENISASPEEHSDDVLKRMADTGAKEMAVLDSEGRIVGDVTATDLLAHYYLGQTKDRDG